MRPINHQKNQNQNQNQKLKKDNRSITKIPYKLWNVLSTILLDEK